MSCSCKELDKILNEANQKEWDALQNLYHEDAINDLVNSPNHYMLMPDKDIEAIDVIEAALVKNLDGIEAYSKESEIVGSWYSQVLKYMLRCGSKGKPKQDLGKAEFYLKRLIANMED